MNSLDEECTPLKTKYDDCFNVWFRDSFLKGKGDHQETCGEFFKSYQQCLKTAIKKQKIPTEELYKDILGTDKEKQKPNPK